MSGPSDAQRRGGVERARADLAVVGLQHHAALVGPVARKRQDDVLEGHALHRNPFSAGCGRHRARKLRARSHQYSEAPSGAGRSTGRDSRASTASPRSSRGPAAGRARGTSRTRAPARSSRRPPRAASPDPRRRPSSRRAASSSHARPSAPKRSVAGVERSALGAHAPRRERPRTHGCRASRQRSTRTPRAAGR